MIFPSAERWRCAGLHRIRGPLGVFGADYRVHVLKSGLGKDQDSQSREIWKTGERVSRRRVFVELSRLFPSPQRIDGAVTILCTRFDVNSLVVFEMQRYWKQEIRDIGPQLMQNPLDLRREEKIFLAQPILHRALS